jgi:hypothetical protein
LPADLDHRGIMDLHVAGHLRLRLGRPQGRPEEKRKRQPERQPRLSRQAGFAAMLASAGAQETIEHSPASA